MPKQTLLNFILYYAKHCKHVNEIYRIVSEDTSIIDTSNPKSIWVLLKDEDSEHLAKIIVRNMNSEKITYAVSLLHGHFKTSGNQEAHNMLMEAIEYGGM
jgi:hypothetical protein